jgi:hypothetical protein
MAVDYLYKKGTNGECYQRKLLSDGTYSDYFTCDKNIPDLVNNYLPVSEQGSSDNSKYLVLAVIVLGYLYFSSK